MINMLHAIIEYNADPDYFPTAFDKLVAHNANITSEQTSKSMNSPSGLLESKHFGVCF